MKENLHYDRRENVAIGGFCNFLCLFRREAGGGYRVTSEDVPDLVAFGDTLDEARENVRDELLVCIGAGEIDDPFRDPRVEERPSVEQ
jgi:predicted RNase H-like HicB family nuclease